MRSLQRHNCPCLGCATNHSDTRAVASRAGKRTFQTGNLVNVMAMLKSLDQVWFTKF